MCVRGQDVRRVNIKVQMKYRELPNETERKGEQEESDRKKERGKRKGEKKRWGQ